ncbi:MAG TPA: dTDP-4-dehydrorhamnose reductase [Candidatus Udaeobacter sp.]|nr:dTDP-4-dehydrorhamnose reductase [Candidatus Udaeobacter sp.]
MSKILVIGNRGMLGQELVKNFQKDYEVIGLDYDAFDITNEKIVKEKINEIKPSLVINAAAYNNVDLAEQKEEEFAKAKMVNGLAVEYLAAVCLENKITIVHYSSDYVFRGDNKNGYVEDAPTDPISKYGESKALGEMLLQNSGANFYLIRLSKLFGPAGGGKKSFVDTMIDLVVNQGKKELKLVNEEFSCPTYSADLVNFTRKLWEDKLPFGIYHGANSGACTWYEFSLEIFKQKNLAVNCIPVAATEFPRPAKRPVFSELLNTKMPKQRDWTEALADYLS